jgi:hypothetical protein
MVMASIGIEFCRTYVVVAFSEPNYPPVLIGDGKRTVIPTAVFQGTWGSKAAENSQAIWMDEDSPQNLDEPYATAFWLGLRARLREFLGVSEGTLSTLPVFVAMPGDIEAAKRMKHELSAHAFKRVEIVSPALATLSAALDGAGATSNHESHLVLSIGDVFAQIAAYSLSGGVIVRSSMVQELFGTGASYWIRDMAADLEAFRGGDRGPMNRLRIWQAMLELAPRLSKINPNEMIPWAGAHSNELITSVMFTPDRLEWNAERRALVHWLREAAPKCVTEIGLITPDNVWLAGSGSLFPVLWTDYADQVREIADPLHAIAIGASLLGHTTLTRAEYEPIAQNDTTGSLELPGPPDAMKLPDGYETLLSQELQQLPIPQERNAP